MKKEPLYLYLKNKSNELVRQERFSCQTTKRRIIDKWKKVYGKKFDDLIVEEQKPHIIEKYNPNNLTIPKYGRVLRNNHTTKRGSDGYGLNN